MKIELNLKDMLSLYLAAYIFRRKGPPEAKEMLDEALDKVLNQLARQAEQQVRQLQESLAEFPTWLEADLINFTERRPARDTNHYAPEQPDFFLSAA